MSDVTKKLVEKFSDSMSNPIFDITARKSDGGGPQSSLRGFLDQMSARGFQIQSNFEVQLPDIPGFQFYCQQINVPDLKTHNGELYYKCRAVQVPIAFEQGHEFQMTVINDGGSQVYHAMRKLCRDAYIRYMGDGDTWNIFETSRPKTINTGLKATIKAMSDQKYSFGSEIKLENLRITNVSGIQFGHSENSIQTFTVDCYANIVDFKGTIPKLKQ